MYKPKNIVLVTLDNLRHDSIFREESMPFTRGLAEQGVFFPRCLSSSNNSGPSLASLFTSTYPYKHKLRKNSDSLREQITTLPSVLKENKIHTAATVSSSLLSKRHGFSRGFEIFYDHSYIANYQNFGFGRFNLFNAVQKVKSILGVDKSLKTWNETNKEVKKTLRRIKSEAFFFYIHYSGAHANPVKESYQSKSNDLENLKEFKRNNINSYYKLERICDKSVESLINILDNEDVLEDTLLIISSDHGESLYENRILSSPAGHPDFLVDGTYKGHGFSLYDSEVLVPLIFYNKRLESQKLEKLVRTIDVAPTVLDFLGIESPPSFDGISLFREGDSSVNNIPFGYSEIPTLYGNSKCIRDNDWKFIWYEKGNPEIFDLVKDPMEIKNLSKDNPDIVKKYVDTMRTILENYGGLENPKENMSPEVKSELVRLGYLK